jgi:hypothetical protein
MLNNSDKNSPDYETINEAFDSMTGMAQHINEMKRRHEDAVRIQEIQSILYQWQGEDLTTYGELLLEVSTVVGLCGAKLANLKSPPRLCYSNH